MLKFHKPQVAAPKTIQLINQKTASNQQHLTLEKHLHIGHFMVQAAEAVEAERLEPMTLSHYQVG